MNKKKTHEKKKIIKPKKLKIYSQQNNLLLLLFLFKLFNEYCNLTWILVGPELLVAVSMLIELMVIAAPSMVSILMVLIVTK